MPGGVAAMVVGSPDSVAAAAVLEEARFEDAEGRGEPVGG
jgi:hypothetical protein